MVCNCVDIDINDVEAMKVMDYCSGEELIWE